MTEFKIRCSSLSLIMSDPSSYPKDDMTEAELEAMSARKRTEDQVAMLSSLMNRTLSEGAKSHIHDLVRQHIYGYEKPELGSKEVLKGNQVESSAISLLSASFGDLFAKNTGRRETDYLTGEADIVSDLYGIDTKCPWSIETFPIIEPVARRMAVKAGYEMQCRGYMHLYNKDKWAVSYVLMPTPTELIPPWQSSQLHLMPMSLPISKRVTTIWFNRDFDIEKKIVIKCMAAKKYAEELISEYESEKGFS